MSTTSIPIAIKRSPRSHHKFATYVVHIADCLDGNASYPDANPSAATLQALAAAFILANAKAKHEGPAAVADRDEKRADLEDQLDVLVAYVRQKVKAEAADPADAATRILSAGLSIRKKGNAPKPVLAAKHGDLSGEIVLVARAVAKAATYYWEVSSDQTTWVSAPQTMRADTMISGLTPGEVYYFRFRAFSRKGLTDYTDVVALRAL